MSNPLPVNEALVTVCLTTWGTVNVNRILGLEHLPDSRETGLEGPSQKQKIPKNSKNIAFLPVLPVGFLMVTHARWTRYIWRARGDYHHRD